LGDLVVLSKSLTIINRRFCNVSRRNAVICGVANDVRQGSRKLYFTTTSNGAVRPDDVCNPSGLGFNGILTTGY
jgi:hypothetical protein